MEIFNKSISVNESAIGTGKHGCYGEVLSESIGMRYRKTCMAFVGRWPLAEVPYNSM